MDIRQLTRVHEWKWIIPATGKMKVPAVFYANQALLEDMDQKVYEQIVNVTTLPGIVEAAFAMPDAHWGYGFPIGGVAAFDPEQGGVISAGGVGFDIACGVRTLLTGLTAQDINPLQERVADSLFRDIPAGLGSTGDIRLSSAEMDAMLAGGARWAVQQGYGEKEDLEHLEEKGCMAGARPDLVSAQAKKRQRDEMGTLGSGNHYLEVQQVADIYDPEVARVFQIQKGDILVSLHCGSRGLGHQIGSEYLKKMAQTASGYGIDLPDRELACSPIKSPLGQEYLGVMRAAINCAMANRQIITHLTRQTLGRLFPGIKLSLLYDVAHNTCKEEEHIIRGKPKNLFVHRKGATRAFGPGHPSLPPAFQQVGQPVIIGGTMGTSSYILVGTQENMELSLGSACHGAGRSMSRKQASRQWRGVDIIQSLREKGIIVRSVSKKGVAEEAPDAYKDVNQVVDAAEQAHLVRRVLRMKPLVCIKG